VPTALFGDAAGDGYDALLDDPAARSFLDRLDTLLEELVRDPGAARSRRTRFQRPPCFRIVIDGPSDEPWCVLWLPEGEDVVVLYVGSDRFR
jgi:hypothetical protein